MCAATLLAGLLGPGKLIAQQAASPEAKWYDRIRFEGDFRPRYDLTYQDKGAGKEDEDVRGRFRFRLRFGVTTEVTRQFTVGFRLASNEGKNPTSGNVTFGSGTAPKTIGLDRVYVTWTPSPRLAVTAGKFASQLEKPGAVFRSELIWDEDLSPEGLSETVTLRRASKGLLRRVAVRLEQWYLQEFTKDVDSWMLGGQLVADLHPSDRAVLTLAAGYYDYANGQALAQAANSNDQIIVTNSVVLKDGTVVKGGQLLRSSASNPFDHFLSDFTMVHGSAAFRLDRILGEAGLQVYGEVASNTKADEDGLAMQIGVGLDRIRKLPGWSVSAAGVWIEQESVLSMFSYSDLGHGGTNLEGLVAQVQYRPARNVTLAARHYVGTPIKAVQPDTPTQRLQVDLTLAF